MSKWLNERYDRKERINYINSLPMEERARLRISSRASKEERQLITHARELTGSQAVKNKTLKNTASSGFIKGFFGSIGHSTGKLIFDSATRAFKGR